MNQDEFFDLQKKAQKDIQKIIDKFQEEIGEEWEISIELQKDEMELMSKMKIRINRIYLGIKKTFS